MKFKLDNSLFLFLLLQFLLIQYDAISQPGTLDPTFYPGGTPYGVGLNEFGSIEAVAIQSDGKIILGGSFDSYNGVSRSGIVRVNADGTLDPTFDPGTGIAGVIRLITSMVILSDGKILIGGSFTSYNGVARNRIARLNSDGSLDMTFASTLDDPVFDIAVQADNKILVGTYSPKGVIRLNANGSTDNSFGSLNLGGNSVVYELTIQANGQLLIGGSFLSVKGADRLRIARLNANGTLDTFAPSPLGEVWAIAEQPDGKIIIGGSFTAMQGAPGVAYLTRVNSDGSLDATFASGAGPDGEVLDIMVQPDGKIVIAGGFKKYNLVDKPLLARLNTDGTLDNGFNPGTSFDVVGLGPRVSSLGLQADGRIVAGGNFNLFGNGERRSIARVATNGEVDLSFNPMPGTDNTVSGIVLQPDGNITIVGAFRSAVAQTRNYAARLTSSGTLDVSFNVGTSSSGPIQGISLQPNGKFVFTGGFKSYNGNPWNFLARVDAGGNNDAGFNPGSGPNLGVNVSLPQADGKILLGGMFTTFNGVSNNRMVRLNSDGSIDGTFAIGTGANNTINSLAIQADGKILIAGAFGSFNGASRGRIARLLPNGSLDTSFEPTVGANATIDRIVLQEDGKVMIIGSFTTYNGTARNRIARINPDGSLDPTFNPGTGTDAIIRAIIVQPDGKVVIAGEFTTYNGAPANKLARININGSLDGTFDAGLSTGTSPILALAQQTDGKILIGGTFRSYNLIPLKNITRVLVEAPPAAPTANAATAVVATNFTANWSSVPGVNVYQLDVSADNFTTFAPGYNSKTVIGTSIAVTGLSGSTAYKYRVRAGNAGWSTDSNVISVTTASLQNQTISFGALPDRIFGTASFTVSATASSGLTVALVSVTPARVSVAGTTASLQSPGLATIRATQSGDGTYGAAANVDQSFCINPAKPIITITGANTGSPTLTSSATEGNQWFKDGVEITGATENTFEVAVEGNYTVRSTVEGCVGEMSSEFPVVVTGDMNDYVPPTFPNPTTGKVVVSLADFDAGIPVRLQITDMTGRMADQQLTTGGDQFDLSMEHLPSGMYILSIEQGSRVNRIKLSKK
ncbi:MAG: T9SS type A sorting domain-containing protein [Cyclobacteriaceae bacterium]|nr:T9SS type A sorting domain-containing protein [Cyclobacteriaceae bacterium]